MILAEQHGLAHVGASDDSNQWFGHGYQLLPLSCRLSAGAKRASARSKPSRPTTCTGRSSSLRQDALLYNHPEIPFHRAAAYAAGSAPGLPAAAFAAGRRCPVPSAGPPRRWCGRRSRCRWPPPRPEVGKAGLCLLHQSRKGVAAAGDGEGGKFLRYIHRIQRRQKIVPQRAQHPHAVFQLAVALVVVLLRQGAARPQGTARRRRKSAGCRSAPDSPGRIRLRCR